MEKEKQIDEQPVEEKPVEMTEEEKKELEQNKLIWRLSTDFQTYYQNKATKKKNEMLLKAQEFDLLTAEREFEIVESELKLFSDNPEYVLYMNRIPIAFGVESNKIFIDTVLGRKQIEVDKWTRQLEERRRGMIELKVNYADKMSMIDSQMERLEKGSDDKQSITTELAELKKLGMDRKESRVQVEKILQQDVDEGRIQPSILKDILSSPFWVK